MTDYDTRFGQYLQMVEAELEGHFKARIQLPYQELHDAMKYSLLSGGKRIRGVMTLAFYNLFDSDAAKALPYAAALEMIHAYSLIHDDLPCMDDDDMRRGKPSCHIAFGEATALLAGDGLLTLAFEAASSCTAFPAERALRAVNLLARAAGAHGMIAGQVLDFANEDRQLTAEQLDAINDRKTAALFRASAEMGCVLGGADEAIVEAAREYTRCVGRAFQIMDDVLDVTADEKTLGKPVGSDRENHRNTYAAIYGVERCRELVAELNGGAKAALARIDADTAFLAQLADHLGSRAF